MRARLLYQTTEKGEAMRGIGNHTPPAHMMLEPADNTSRFIDAQVKAWHWSQSYPEDAAKLQITAGIVIHAEAAREIAAWWQTSTGRGLDFCRFAGSGEITAGLLASIDYELSKPEAEQFGSDQALKALRAYVVAASS